MAIKRNKAGVFVFLSAFLIFFGFILLTLLYCFLLEKVLRLVLLDLGGEK